MQTDDIDKTDAGSRGARPSGSANPQDWHYAAFISYAHKDGAAAAQLHKRLERYRPQKSLRSRRNQLRPIFRDIEELTAHHSLSDKIRQAVEGSRRLIVLCSPAAKASKWVNAEIRLFRERHGEGAIFCALLEGTPETSFPEALTEDGREPLAANLSGGKENFRFGVLQLTASLLDVGLDAVVRRDARRRRQLLASVMSGALVFSGSMGLAAYSALQAKKQAEANRAEAEGLVEYMITELKDELQPVGRLDIVDGVGDKIMAYYETQSILDMPDERIMRYARALHLLGQVDLQAQRYSEAEQNIEKSYDLTKTVLGRNPASLEAIFAHAQSAYWWGDFLRATQGQKSFQPYWKEYYALTQQLYNHDNTKFEWIMEAAYGENNMGSVYRYEGEYALAHGHYDKAVVYFGQALDVEPDNAMAQSERLNTLVGGEQTALAQGEYDRALRYKRRINALSEAQALRDPKNFQAKDKRAASQSNFVWQYNLLLPRDELAGALLKPVKTLEELHKHDLENLGWRQRYYWHLILMADLTVSKPAKLKAIDRLETTLKNSPSPETAARYVFYRKYLQIQKYHILGETEEALRRARALAQQSRLDLHAENRTEHKAIQLGVLALQFHALGQAETAKHWARQYLEYIGDASPAQLDTIYYKASSHHILGDCRTAQQTLRPILEYGAGDHPRLQPIKNCEK